MGIKISNLPAIVTPALTDVFPVVQSGVTYKESITQLSSLLATVGVTTITGTANQVIASASTGPVIISLPQSIATTSDVTFGSITFSPTTSGLVGTLTNNNASAGKVGEFISSVIAFASGGAATTLTPRNVTSISLTAGDWDVWGNVGFTGDASTSVVAAVGWISSTSATQPDVSLITYIPFSGITGTNTAPISVTVPCLRFALAGTTTIYLSTNQAFSVSTLSTFGGIYARRRR